MKKKEMINRPWIQRGFSNECQQASVGEVKFLSLACLMEVCERKKLEKKEKKESR